MKNIPVESESLLLRVTRVSTNKQSKHGHKASPQDFATVVFHQVSSGLGGGQGFGSGVKAILTTVWDKHVPLTRAAVALTLLCPDFTYSRSSALNVELL